MAPLPAMDSKSPPDRQLLGTSYLNGMWDLVASGLQGNKTACGFASPDPRPTRRHSIGRFITLVYQSTYVHTLGTRRETREDRKIDRVACYGKQPKRGRDPHPAPGNRTRGLPLRPLRWILTETQASQPIISNHEG